MPCTPKGVLGKKLGKERTWEELGRKLIKSGE
jgi:hypothetical protein